MRSLPHPLHSMVCTTLSTGTARLAGRCGCWWWQAASPLPPGRSGAASATTSAGQPPLPWWFSTWKKSNSLLWPSATWTGKNGLLFALETQHIFIWKQSGSTTCLDKSQKPRKICLWGACLPHHHMILKRFKYKNQEREAAFIIFPFLQMTWFLSFTTEVGIEKLWW